MQIGFNHPLHRIAINVLQVSLNADQSNRAISQGHQAAAQLVQAHTQGHQQQRPQQLLQTPPDTLQARARQTQARHLPWLRRLHAHGATAACLTAGRRRCTACIANSLHSVIHQFRVPARMASTRSPKLNPVALAAMGTRLWSVMPGTVLTSSR